MGLKDAGDTEDAFTRNEIMALREKDAREWRAQKAAEREGRK